MLNAIRAALFVVLVTAIGMAGSFGFGEHVRWPAHRFCHVWSSCPFPVVQLVTPR